MIHNLRRLGRPSALRAEWSHLSKNKILIISVIVMLFIPIMYGGFFLGSIWDPYGNTAHLPVAIVNDDKGATLNGTTLHIGDDLVKKLASNKDMGWHFVSANDAAEGIQNGTYYMALTIPKNFSQDVTTITTDHPTKSTLPYTVTPAKNYVASLLTNQAAEKIKQTVSSSISDAYVSSILASTRVLGYGLSDAANGASKLAIGGYKLQSGVAAYTNGVSQVATGQAHLSMGLASLSSGSLALKSGMSQLGSQLPTQSQISQLTTGVASIQNGLNQLNYAAQTPDPSLAAIQTSVQANSMALENSLVALQTVSQEASASLTTLGTAVATASGSTITVNVADVAHALQVAQQAEVVGTDAQHLLENLSALTAALSTQQLTLQTNISTLANGTNALSPHLINALNGYTTVAQGNALLLDGATQLYNGTVAASTGSNTVLNGLTTLTQSSGSLTSGVSALATGNNTLSTSLSNAASQIALQPTSAATQSQIVTPVTAQETTIGHVPNYGYALSPYVLSLGLFVGALVFNVIYPVRRLFGRPRTAVRWWLSKMSIAFVVAIGQAFVLDAIMVYGLGLHPNNPGQFVLLSVVTSITYMSIISFLAIALDNIGRFLAMLLLVLQLGSAEGVFPIVLSPRFFQLVNPYVPMTYSIRAFREAISSGLGPDAFWHNLSILAVIILITNFLLIGFFRVHGMRHFKHEAIES